MTTIVTGGQTGADLAGWKTAKFPEFANRFITAGWMPVGFTNELGGHPRYASDYGARELEDISSWSTLANQYRERTRRNVAISSAVIWIGDSDSRGGLLTKKLAARENKRFFTIDPSETKISNLMIKWLLPYDSIMIAGNRESRCPGIEEKATRYLQLLFTELMRRR